MVVSFGLMARDRDVVPAGRFRVSIGARGGPGILICIQVMAGLPAGPDRFNIAMKRPDFD
jgi:hypothetical protein